MSEEELNELVNEENIASDYDDSSQSSGVIIMKTRTTQRWYQSKVLWISILSLLGVVIVNVFNLIDSEVWNTIVTAVLSIMSVFGIVNSPSSSNSLE